MEALHSRDGASRKGNIIPYCVPRPKGDYGTHSGQSEGLIRLIFDQSFELSISQSFLSDSLGGPSEVIHRPLILNFGLRNMNYPTARLLELSHRLPPPCLFSHHKLRDAQQRDMLTEKFSQQGYNVSDAKYIFVIWFIFLALSVNIDLKMKSGEMVYLVYSVCLVEGLLNLTSK